MPLQKRGFTLIELLVVIAIIGILSAVVLASLTGARTKGNDAAVKANLNTVRTEAELYYGGAGSNTYGTGVTGATGSCTTAGSMWAADTTIKQAIASIIVTYGAETEATDYRCTSQAQTYMFSNKLATGYICIDNTGVIKTEGSLPAASVWACP